MQPSETPTSAAIPPSLTEDGFLGGRLRILQPEKGFRAGIDSVFLAAAVPCRPGENVLEAGSGPGVAALCLLARTPEVQLTGIEIAPRHAEICAENARRNGMAERLRDITADLRGRAPAGLPATGSFAHAMMNPPFFDEAKSTPSPDALKSQAHAFGPEDLVAWVKFLHARLAPKGSLTIVHRADSLARAQRKPQGMPVGIARQFAGSPQDADFGTIQDAIAPADLRGVLQVDDGVFRKVVAVAREREQLADDHRAAIRGIRRTSLHSVQESLHLAAPKAYPPPHPIGGSVWPETRSWTCSSGSRCSAA